MALGLLHATAKAEPITFFVGADPQYGFGDDALATETGLGAARILNRCTDCSKVLVVAGDLSHDKPDKARKYGEVFHLPIEKLGVKVFDGLGNHDNNDFADDWVSFDSPRGLYHMGSLASDDRAKPMSLQEIEGHNFVAPRFLGWRVYDLFLSRIDNEEKASQKDIDWRVATSIEDSRYNNMLTSCGSFGYGDAWYCMNEDAYYYAIELNKPTNNFSFNLNFWSTPNPKPGVLLVQLHNELYSTTSTRYLKRIRDKLSSEGRLDLPVILFSHKTDGTDGTMSPEFKKAAADMNIAAVIHGHYGCDNRSSPKKLNGHCDASNTWDDLRDWSEGIYNRNRVDVPIIDVNALLYGIFWAVQIDPSKGTIGFVRFNSKEMMVKSRGGKSFISLETGTFADLMAQIFRNNPSAINIPRRKNAIMKCDYEAGRANVSINTYSVANCSY